MARLNGKRFSATDLLIEMLIEVLLGVFPKLLIPANRTDKLDHLMTRGKAIPRRYQ